MPSHSNRKIVNQPIGAAGSAIHKTAKEKSSELKKFKKDVFKFVGQGGEVSIKAQTQQRDVVKHQRDNMISTLAPKNRSINFRQLQLLRREEKKKQEELKEQQAIVGIGSSSDYGKDDEILKKTSKKTDSYEMKKLNQKRGNRRGEWEDKTQRGSGFKPTVGRFMGDGALHLKPGDIKRINAGETVFNKELSEKPDRKKNGPNLDMGKKGKGNSKFFKKGGGGGKKGGGGGNKGGKGKR